jgi:cyclic pyranopterin phosphate synthase
MASSLPCGPVSATPLTASLLGAATLEGNVAKGVTARPAAGDDTVCIRLEASRLDTVTVLAETAAGVRPLTDTFGRVATDLRVSLTDRCNLRCQYCMPADGLDWLPGEGILTDDEVARLLRIAIEQLGVTEIRLTGGEPLLRPGLVDIVAAAAAMHPRPEISLTTNGLSLRRRAAALAGAGLDRVNVSLDTVDRETFQAITRRDRLHDALDGLAAAAEVGLTPVKVNAVLLRGLNDAQAPALLDFCLTRGYELRIIEQMPLDAGHAWNRERMVTADETLATLQAHFELTPDPAERGSAPAERWLIDGGPARVGIIASVTRPFCADCDRVRLTADGQVRNCLFAREESDLRAAMRGGASDEELAERWRAAMWRKLPGHGIDDPGFLQPARPMSAIGG